MKPFVVLPALGILLLGILGAVVAGWATSGTSQDFIPIDRAVTITDRTGPTAFSYFLNLTSLNREHVVKAYFLYNTSVDQKQRGTGGTVLVTSLYADGVEAQGIRDTIERPQRFYIRSALRTTEMDVPAGHAVALRVDVTSEPVSGPQADWAIEHHAMEWEIHRKVPPMWSLVLALGGGGILGAAAWVFWARRRHGPSVAPVSRMGLPVSGREFDRGAVKRTRAILLPFKQPRPAAPRKEP